MEDNVKKTSKKVDLDENGKFYKGCEGGPGRLKGSKNHNGRLETLKSFDEVLMREGNQKRFQDALQKEFKANPTKFFRRYIIPLLPNNSNINLKTDFGEVLQEASAILKERKNGSEHNS